MNPAQLEALIQAVLYEGYILYPYRPSAKKNCRGRFTFGRVYPEAFAAAQNGAEPCLMQTECLVRTSGRQPEFDVSVRFLQPVWREAGALDAPWAEQQEPVFHVVPQVSVDGALVQTWQEALEREVKLSVGEAPASATFAFPAARTVEPLRDAAGHVRGVLVRRQESLAGAVEAFAQPLNAQITRLTVRVLNRSSVPEAKLQDAEAVLMQTFASTHTTLRAQGGEFISAMDPPKECKALADACRNIGTWPVLVGDESSKQSDTVLSSPITLYDFPRLAPESPVGFCDGTEIDEMLTLRVLTMTDEEKREMRHVDEFARRMLERTEALPHPQRWRMHGAMRDAAPAEQFFNPSRPVEAVMLQGVQLRKGDRVRVQPRQRADALDLILKGRVGVIEAIEQDAEDRIHVALVLEDDPGKDLGLQRQPGHRFFYGLDELEPVQEVGA